MVTLEIQVIATAFSSIKGHSSRFSPYRKGDVALENNTSKLENFFFFFFFSSDIFLYERFFCLLKLFFLFF